MTVYHAGFAERVFEFAFNTEFVQKNKFVMAACPYLPSQNQEKLLGYDVAMKIEKGGGARSTIFLQHKVARFVDARHGSNARLFDAVGGPYCAFPLDVDQYNVIHSASLKRRENIYYCAPIFTARSELESAFFAQTVVDHSLWIDVRACGAIAGTKSHSIVFSKDGKQAFRFSDEGISATVLRASFGREYERRVDTFDVQEVRGTYEYLFEVLAECWPQRRVVHTVEGEVTMRRSPPLHREILSLEDAIEAVQDLAVNYYGMSWLIGVHE